MLLLDDCEVVPSLTDLGELSRGVREVFLCRDGPLAPREYIIAVVDETSTCVTRLDLDKGMEKLESPEVNCAVATSLLFVVDRYLAVVDCELLVYFVRCGASLFKNDVSTKGRLGTMGVKKEDKIIFEEIVEVTGMPGKTRRELAIERVEFKAPVADRKSEEEPDLFKTTLGGKLVTVDVKLPG